MHTGFLTIYWRDILKFVRSRSLQFDSLIQPVLWLAFFGIAIQSNFDRLTAAQAETLDELNKRIKETIELYL